MEYRVIQMETKTALSPVLLKSTHDPIIAKISALKESNLYDYVYINVIDMNIGLHIDTCFEIQKR